MKRLKQPGPTLCGPTSVAMVAGITVDEACQWIGKRGLTHGTDLRRGLERLGYVVEKTDGLAGMGYGRVHGPGMAEKGHWFAFQDGVVYDPWFDGGIFDWAKPYRITSLFSVTPKPQLFQVKEAPPCTT